MAEGPIRKNSVYLGESYDASAVPQGWLKVTNAIQGWQAAKEVARPSGKLTSQIQEPIRVTKIVKPIAVREVSTGKYVFDMGQNFAGVARIRVKGDKGTLISLRYGEELLKDGNINVMTSVAGQIKRSNSGSGAPEIAWQEDSYTLAGNGIEVWNPRFTFHGFRYVEVIGWPGKPTLNDIEGLRMNSDVAVAGEFKSSNSMFNKLHDMVDWTFRSNMFSVQSDFPAMEKFGYGGDIAATAEAFLYRYDMAKFYQKAVQDFENDQRPLGGITETAPYVGISDKGAGDKSGPLGWQLAFRFLIKHLYDFYGDKRVIEQHYDAVVKQVKFLRETSKGNLHFTDISDHEALDTKPEAFSASVFYMHHVTLLAGFAEILGKEEDTKAYHNLAGQIKRSIVAQYMVPGAGRFDNGTQSAQILALYYQLSSESERENVFKQLMSEIERHNNHVSTGMFATKMLFDVMRNLNRNDIAYMIANQRSFPGWGYMIDKRATTIWETWAYSDNVFSQNHPMFGCISEWFYRPLLGINSSRGGFEKIIIKPQPVADLTAASGHYISVRGKIASSWKQDEKTFQLSVTVPANTTAEIWLPTSGSKAITESGKPISFIAEISIVKEEEAYVVIKAGNGSYTFEAGR